MWENFGKFKEKARVYFEKHLIGIVIIVFLLLAAFRLFMWHGDACIELSDEQGKPVDGCSFDFYGAEGEPKPEADGPVSCSGAGKYYFKGLPVPRGLYFRPLCGDQGRGWGSSVIITDWLFHLLDRLPQDSLSRKIILGRFVHDPNKTIPIKIILGKFVNGAEITVSPSEPLMYWEEGYSGPPPCEL